MIELRDIFNGEKQHTEIVIWCGAKTLEKVQKFLDDDAKKHVKFNK